MASEPFVLGQATLSVFASVLEISKELTKDQKIRYRIGAGGTLSLKVDDAALKQVLSKHGMEQDVFTRAFDTEVSAMLNAVLSEEERNLVLLRCSPDSNPELKGRSEEEIADYRKVFEQKLERVKELATDDLRGKYLIKRTSKHYRFRGHSWEVNLKLADKHVEKPVDYPYVTMAFDTIHIDPEVTKGVGGQVIKFLFPNYNEWAGRVRSVVFDLDIDDLTDLIDSLSSARSALAQRLGRKKK